MHSNLTCPPGGPRLPTPRGRPATPPVAIPLVTGVIRRALGPSKFFTQLPRLFQYLPRVRAPLPAGLLGEVGAVLLAIARLPGSGQQPDRHPPRSRQRDSLNVHPSGHSGPRLQVPSHASGEAGSVTGDVPFGCLGWLRWVGDTLAGNVFGGLVLGTLMRLVRSKERLQEERSDAEGA